MTPADRATFGAIVARYPGLAAAVHTQVSRLLAAVLPAADGAIATEASSTRCWSPSSSAS